MVFREERFETIDRAGPERLMPLQPLLRAPQGLTAQTEAMLSPLDRARDESRFFQHLQVFGDRRLRRSEPAAQLARGARLTLRQHLNHRPARPIREGMERAVQRDG